MDYVGVGSINLYLYIIVISQLGYSLPEDILIPLIWRWMRWGM